MIEAFSSVYGSMLNKLNRMKGGECVKRNVVIVVYELVGHMIGQPKPQLFTCDEAGESDDLCDAPSNV